MNAQISENQIRERANKQSFLKGQDYYQAGAIFNPTWQSAPGGILLLATCEGSSTPSYQITAKLDSSGITSATCTCPYDWGGDCKHIVALLLTYHNQSGVFAERKSVDELFTGVEKEALAMIIARLVERDPDLYDELEAAIQVVKVAARVQSPGPMGKIQTQVSEQA